MDNVQIDAETLKNYQLIKFGLEKALGIPKYFETRAKVATKERK